jgi:hypothetical protein
MDSSRLIGVFCEVLNFNRLSFKLLVGSSKAIVVVISPCSMSQWSQLEKAYGIKNTSEMVLESLIPSKGTECSSLHETKVDIDLMVKS